LLIAAPFGRTAQSVWGTDQEICSSSTSASSAAEAIGGDLEGSPRKSQGRWSKVTIRRALRAATCATSASSGGGNGSKRRLPPRRRGAIAAANGWPNRPRERETISLSAEGLAKFAGEYNAGRIGRVRFRVVDDHLVDSIPEQWEIALCSESADVFFSVRRGVPNLKFSRDEAGAVAGFTGGGVTAKRVK